MERGGREERRADVREEPASGEATDAAGAAARAERQGRKGRWAVGR